MIPDASNWNLADTKAMLAEAGMTLEVLSAVDLAEALQEVPVENDQ